MARSYLDDLNLRYASITRYENLFREMERAANPAAEMMKSMEKAMGLASGMKKAMGLDLDFKKAIGLNVAETAAVGRLMELDTEALAVAKASYGGLSQSINEFAENHRLSFEAHIRAIETLVPPLNVLAYSESIQGIRAVTDTLASLDLGINFSSWARTSFDALIGDIYVPGFGGFRPPSRNPSEWIEGELELLLLSTPEYTESKLAWILELFIPRLRLALYKQDRDGDFDGVMEEFWEKLIQDPEVRQRLRQRLEQSGIKEELHKCLSGHLEKIGEGEWLYAILGLYAHIEAFLAELAVQNGLIPHPEFILCPKSGKKVNRRGVKDLIETLQRAGRISPSQYLFLNYVLSNQYNSNRVRHGMSLEFSPARATALVLALILALCLAWGMGPTELLEPEEEQN